MAAAIMAVHISTVVLGAGEGGGGLVVSIQNVPSDRSSTGGSKVTLTRW